MTTPNTGFNLVDDPWIELGDRTVSIREALLSGHELPGWPSGEPAAGPVILRLLMPIVYRVTRMDDPELRGPRFAERQAQLLSVGWLDPSSVNGYLDRFRDRFWLTGPPAGFPPFAQDPTLAAVDPHPISKLVPTWATGSNPTLGPHAPVATLDPAAAARCLLITHSYSSEGIYTGRTADKPRSNCVASRLRRTVSVHPVGSSFAETLLYHLAPAPDGWEMGSPSWELPPAVNPTGRPRKRAGFLEQLSGRHDKAVLLATCAGGEVTGVVISGGPGREQGLECPDPYTVITADGEPYKLQAGRDAWRDIDGLVIHSADLKPADQLESPILDQHQENNGITAALVSWALVSHRSTEPGKEHGWGLVNLPDIIGLFSKNAARRTASAVIVAAEDASALIGKKLRALSHEIGGDDRAARYDDARRMFWSLAEHTFWEAVTAEAPDPTSGAQWVGRLRAHALAGFDAATGHLTQLPRTHLAVEQFRSEIFRWGRPNPTRNQHPTEGQTTS